ncbi:hypothetical protein K8T06_00125 [bacterium]|nr:hypothetical protein [bacterium]
MILFFVTALLCLGICVLSINSSQINAPSAHHLYDLRKKWRKIDFLSVVVTIVSVFVLGWVKRRLR